jgi:peptidoglycan/LPS O-acetylase OafA/YrhL
VVFGLIGLWLRRELRPLVFAILAQTALMGCWWAWEGGWCQGPRMLADATPFFGLGIAAALREWSAWRRPARAGLAVAAAVSCATAMVLTYVYPSRQAYALFGALRDGPWTVRAHPLLAQLSAR